jgi:MSHA biogenesis protein MshJ
VTRVPYTDKIAHIVGKLDALSLRERALVFAAGMIALCVAFESLLMTPLTERVRAAEHRLGDARQHALVLAQSTEVSAPDPIIAAITRNRALKSRLAELDTQLNNAAQGYVSPGKMTEMLQGILAQQRGLSLVSLSNLPVQSLAQDGVAKDSAAKDAGAAKADGLSDHDPGPFLHPMEIVVEGDYASLVTYLRGLEGLPWRISWQRLELTAGAYPVNRVRIVIGAMSLSRDWIDV